MPTRMQSALLAARQRRRKAQNLKQYEGLVASPGDLGAGVKLPANARLSLKVDTSTTTGDVTVDVSGRTLGIAGGAAGTEFKLGWHEEGKTVSASGSTGATATLYIQDEWGRLQAIATGTV
jgi:hypothetical protein